MNKNEKENLIEKIANDRQRRIEPFNLNGFSCATSGTIIVRFKEFRHYPEPEKMILESESSLTFAKECKPEHVMPELPKVEYITCIECAGNGEVETHTQENIYINRCKTCNGEQNIIDKNQHILIGGEKLSVKLLHFLSDVPNLRIYIKQTKLHYFTFDGGDGILMGMRK